MPRETPPELQARLDGLKALCERHDWTFRSWTGTQREPGDGVSITLGVTGRRAMSLRAESQDSMMVAVARMEQALGKLAMVADDEYLKDRHPLWGQV